jgi:phosphopantetheinyl transferase
MKRSWTFNNRIELFLYENVAADDRADLLKKHLGTALAKSPDEIELERRHDGKWLLRSSDKISFSTSHSRDRLLIAIDTSGRPLGIDLQFQEADIDFSLLVRHLYSAVEQQELQNASEEKRKDLATQLWCLKEARFKAYSDSTFTHPDESSITEDLGDGYHFAACSF